MLLLISSSLPITGSNLPLFAKSVTLIENFLNEFEFIDLLEVSMVCPFLILIIDFLKTFLV